MSDLTPGAVEHLYPVAQVIVAVTVIVAAVVGTLWKGFRWLRSQMGEVVSEAFVKWSAVYDQKLEDLRRRDEERAQAVSRLHKRVDEAWVAMNHKADRNEVHR
jgi:hypothetical protein